MAIEAHASPKLTVDPREGTVTGPRGSVRLEPKVMEVLLVLARRPEHVVSREELLDAVWPGVVVTEHTLSRCIYQLRNELGKIGKAPGQADFNPVETLPKRGYRLKATIKMASAQDAAMPLGLFSELRRRRVFRVAAVYAVVAWGLTEAMSFLIGKIPVFPDWLETLIAILFVMGFPVVMFLAWVFDLGPQGIRRTPPASPRGLLAICAAMGLLVVATATFFFLLYPRGMDTIADLDRATASIAVLPFDNRSPDPDNAYFADGMHDDLLTILSKLGGLRVTSRTSVEKFRSKDATIPQIAETLGVAHVLAGAVQRVGNRVRINVQLIAAEDDNHLWGEAYDRELTAANIFAIQSEVAAAIAEALLATLSVSEKERIRSAPTDDLDAYEAYLLGKQRMAKRISTSLAEAVDYFQKAITLDPNFALAYVGLADSYDLQVAHSGAPQAEMNAKAEAAINMALKIDDKLGEAYTSLGWLKQQRMDFDGAETAYKKALILNPGYATTYHWYGNLLRNSGRSEEAVVQHTKGIELDPLSTIINLNLGNDFEILGRFDEALDQYRKTIEIDPSFSVGYATIADIYWFVHGDLAQAVSWYRRGIALDPENPVTLSWLGRLYLDLQNEDKAGHWINRSMELAPESLDANYAMALLQLRRGDKAQALQVAKRFMATNPLWYSSMLVFLRNDDLAAGRYAEARELYEKSYPVLLNRIDPAIDRTNYHAAIDLALVYRTIGDAEGADRLLGRSLALTRTMPRLGIAGYGISDVRIHTLQAQKEQALAALAQAINQGWRNNWWYCLEQDPTLEAIRHEPRFLALMADVEADMAAQLQQVREMEANGDLEPVPVVGSH